MSTANTINTNVAAIRTGNIYSKNNTAMNAAMTRVATAQKINSAKDNASVWAITEKMRDRIRANDQANQNIQNDSALLRTAQDGMGNTLSILETLKERAIASANDSNTNSDRTKIVEEAKQLVRQIDDNAAKVKFNDRALLNGAFDPTSGSSSSRFAGTVAPNAVTASGDYGDMAVYSFTGFKTKDGSAIDLTTTKLVDLTDESGNALFRAGDKISLSWTEDGVDKTATVSVGSTTKITALVGTGALSGTLAYKQAGDELTAKDENGTKLSANATGLYFEGTINKNISNLAIGVTSASGKTRTETQAIFEANAIQQSYGDTAKGSNKVYNVSGLTASHTETVGTTSVTINHDNNTEFYRFGTAGATGVSADSAKDLITTEYTLTVNDKEIKFYGSDSINKINEMLADAGINVRLDYAEANEQISYDDEEVTKGTYGANAKYETAAEGLKIIAGSDQEINTLKITADSTATSSLFKSGSDYDTTKGSSSKITVELLRDDTTATEAATNNSSLLPQGDTLQFYVGGEANFGVNFTIGKATVQNLFGMSDDAFSGQLATKEGAEKALGIIDKAIDKILTEQTRLGSMERRMGFTSDNLVSMNENLEAGYSAYRDSDIAKEMTAYMKFAVLSQASQYMLSQANQNPFQALNLLSQ